MSVVEELVSQGFDVKNTKILAASPRRVENYYALGLRFVLKKDEKGRPSQHGWTAVTMKQAHRLKDLIDPVTNESYLMFAYVPLPADLLKKKQERLVDRVDVAFLTGLPAGAEEVEFNETLAKKSTREQDSFVKIEMEQQSKGFHEESDDSAIMDKDDFIEVEKSGRVVEERTQSDVEQDGMTTATAIERKELQFKTVAELKIMIKDMGMEIPKRVNKDELIEMIVG